jgi:RNA polymerase sigma-70 factor (ECF subfamily)
LNKRIDFEGFFKENYSCFFHFAHQIVNDAEVCRDIVGDAFEHAWKRYDKIEVSNWKTYLYSYIRNRCVDYIRHQAVEKKYAEFFLHIYSEKDEDYTDRDEQIAIMRKMLSKLPPRTLFVLQECYLHNKKYREVANELNISVSAVKKHIVKALKIMRENFAKEQGSI